VTHTNKIGIAILLSTLLISHLSFAASCYEQSPNYVSLGDKYYDIENNTPLTASDKKIVNTSLKKMVGNWEGKGTLFQCLGPESAPIAETKQFTLLAKVSTNSSNELHVDAEKYLLNEKIKSQDHLFFFGAANNYRSALITSNKIILVESFRQVRIEEQENPQNKSEEEAKKNSDTTARIRSFMQERIKFKEEIEKNYDKKIPAQSFRREKIETNKYANKKAQEKFRPFYELIHTIEHTKTHFNYSLRKYINGRLAIEERWQLAR